MYCEYSIVFNWSACTVATLRYLGSRDRVYTRLEALVALVGSSLRTGKLAFSERDQKGTSRDLHGKVTRYYALGLAQPSPMDKPSSQPSRILDALLVAADTSRDGSHGTPNRIPLQNSNSPVLPEAGGSNLKKRARTLDLARQVQEKLMSQSGAVADASFLSSSLSSSPAALGGFQLNYDADTPIRAIDVGGHDQEEKLVSPLGF